MKSKVIRATMLVLAICCLGGCASGNGVRPANTVELAEEESGVSLAERRGVAIAQGLIHLGE